MKVISGSSNPQLAQSLAQKLQLPLIERESSIFKNGEKRVWIKDQIRGENIVFVQDFADPSVQPIMEFLLMTDALERMGARHINLVMPWMGYSLQDKVFREGEPISAKILADVISNAYVKRVFTLDLHNSSIPGFFSIPTHHLSAMKLFIDYAKKTFDLSHAIIASPDFGGLKRARVFADLLEMDLINIDKQRNLETGEVTPLGFQGGNIKGKTVLIFDDCINTGSTLIELASFLKEQGAKEVHFMATHGPLVKSATTALDQSAADSIVVTNSIHVDNLSKKFTVLDVTDLFAEELKDWL